MSLHMFMLMLVVFRKVTIVVFFHMDIKLDSGDPSLL